MKILHGDNLDILKSFESNSIDAVATDPPYGLKFMNKKWDHSVPSIELWREVLRVLKPGGHLLSFGGTRTYHRMVVNIEDAGFEIRDQIMWLYGSGFPKSHNISKGIDKKFGAEREVVGVIPSFREAQLKTSKCYTARKYSGDNSLTVPATDQAKQWDGFGTALKPANEPIVLARKPLSEKTIVDNVLKWGVGGINIDGCRVGTNPGYKYKNTGGTPIHGGGMNTTRSSESTQGRFPANIILDEVAGEMLDEQSGNVKSRGQYKNFKETSKGIFQGGNPIEPNKYAGQQGGASRFFYCAKASKSERGDGNGHPTVKPIRLMQYLTRLITPPGGTVLDPFMGSGTTGIACKDEGFNFIGIEISEEYFEIAEKRISGR